MIDFTKMKTSEQREAEQLAELRASVRAEALSYLAKTDWFVTRLTETGKAIPDDVLKLRQEARTKANGED